MRFICDTNELNTALSIVSRALAVRSTKPILEGILFESCDEGLRLTCTDLALGIETLLPATFSEEGRAVLPGFRKIIHFFCSWGNACFRESSYLCTRKS